MVMSTFCLAYDGGLRVRVSQIILLMREELRYSRYQANSLIFSITIDIDSKIHHENKSVLILGRVNFLFVSSRIAAMGRI